MQTIALPAASNNKSGLKRSRQDDCNCSEIIILCRTGVCCVDYLLEIRHSTIARAFDRKTPATRIRLIEPNVVAAWVRREQRRDEIVPKSVAAPSGTPTREDQNATQGVVSHLNKPYRVVV